MIPESRIHYFALISQHRYYLFYQLRMKLTCFRYNNKFSIESYIDFNTNIFYRTHIKLNKINQSPLAKHPSNFQIAINSINIIAPTIKFNPQNRKHIKTAIRMPATVTNFQATRTTQAQTVAAVR